MKYNQEKLDELREKIFSRFEREDVESNQEYVSFYDLKEVLKTAFEKYNIGLIEDPVTDIKKTNVMVFTHNLIYSRKKIPYIYSMYPTVTKDGNCFITVMFCDFNDKYKGTAYISRNYTIYFEFLNSDYSQVETQMFINKNNQIFTNYFALMDEFIKKYPGFDYEWAYDNNNTYSKWEYKDGLLYGYIDLNNIRKSYLSLLNMNDLELSQTDTSKYEQLIDCIEMYNEALMKKTKVSIDSLNPLFRALYEKNRVLDKPKEHKLKID